MAELSARLAMASRAVRTLDDVLAAAVDPLLRRDAAIKRFEYSFDTVWKVGRQALLTLHGSDMRSPKSVIRECGRLGFLPLDDAEAAIRMTDDRNLTAHTYDEALAAQIMQRIPDHAALLRRWLTAIEQRLSPPRG